MLGILLSTVFAMDFSNEVSSGSDHRVLPPSAVAPPVASSVPARLPPPARGVAPAVAVAEEFRRYREEAETINRGWQDFHTNVHGAVAQERDRLKGENANLRSQFDGYQKLVEETDQAELEFLKGLYTAGGIDLTIMYNMLPNSSDTSAGAKSVLDIYDVLVKMPPPPALASGAATLAATPAATLAAAPAATLAAAPAATLAAAPAAPAATLAAAPAAPLAAAPTS